MTNHVILTGGAVGLETLTGLRFLPHRPFAGCRICGEVFQSEADRFPGDVFEANPREFDFQPSNVDLYALGMRREWSIKHAKKHSERMHQALADSGLWATPEAAQKLVSYGVIDLGDTIVTESTNEHSQALMESSPIPSNDAQE